MDDGRTVVGEVRGLFVVTGGSWGLTGRRVLSGGVDCLWDCGRENCFRAASWCERVMPCLMFCEELSVEILIF